MSNYYWAKFVKIDSNMFRLDTRIYLEGVNKPLDNDKCIGAVVGKNPGSAIPNGKITDDIQPIDLDGDNLLPTVRSIFLKAYENTNKTVEANSYIQMLNLMYICDKDLSSAIKKNLNYEEPVVCEAEKKSVPFLWYVWGNSNKNLNEFKKRFGNIKADKHFYFNTKEKKMVDHSPASTDPARHTQGLPHDSVVPFISKIL